MLWSKEVREVYEPVRRLGKGGFGDVWLGRASSSSDEGEEEAERLVAVKAVDASTAVGRAFAQREAAILRRLEHPHVNRLLRVFRCDVTTTTYLALSFADGPTLERVVVLGGAVGLPALRVVCRQLVRTVAWLHDRAVLHRDLKPDNIVLTGGLTVEDDLFWDDDADEDVVSKIHVVLVDFGFSRALQAKDMAVDSGLYKTMEEDKYDLLRYDVDGEAFLSSDVVHDDLNRSLNGSSHHQGGGLRRSLRRGRSRTRDGLDGSLGKSISHTRVRDLSALGNRMYAAPEIINGVHNKPTNTNSTQRQEALTACVSDYGMDADAFSLGATLRYAMTGVPPGLSVDQYIAHHHSLVRKTLKGLAKRLGKKKQQQQVLSARTKRKKRFRRTVQCPKNAALLLRGLTHRNPHQRTTVRAARYYPWVFGDDDDDDDDTGEGPVVNRHDKVVFLDLDETVE